MPPLSRIDALERRMERIEGMLGTILAHLGLPEPDVSEDRDADVLVDRVLEEVGESSTAEQEKPGLFGFSKREQENSGFFNSNGMEQKEPSTFGFGKREQENPGLFGFSKRGLESQSTFGFSKREQENSGFFNSNGREQEEPSTFGFGKGEQENPGFFTFDNTEQKEPSTVKSGIYSYSSLDTSRSEIRILALRKTDKDTDPLKGETIVVSLDEGNEPLFGRQLSLERARKARSHFLALSYAWGDLKKRSSMNLDGYEFPITKNLEAALRQMRNIQQLWKTHESYWWIDAICINQEDVLERNQQVSMMRRIYKNADRVHVWLGIEAENSATAISMINRISQLHERGPGEPDIQYSNELEEQKLLNWRALAALFQRQWWERVWVRQEVSLGKRPLIHCGSSVTSLKSAITLAKKLNDVVDGLGFDPDQSTDLELSHTSTATSSFRVPPYLQASLFSGLIETGFFTNAKYRSLEDLMFWTRNCKATDLRDKLFSIIGLADPEIHGIKPDYRLLITDLMKRAARSIIEDKRSLGLLRHCQNPERRYGIPSWVPNIVEDWKTWPNVADEQETWSFKPLHTTEYSFDHEDPDILRIRGRYLDSIKLLGGSAIHQNSTIEQLQAQYDGWRSFASQAPAPTSMVAKLKKLYVKEIQNRELVRGQAPGGNNDVEWGTFLNSSIRYIKHTQAELRGSESEKAWTRFLSLGHNISDAKRFETDKMSPHDRVEDRIFKCLLTPDQFLTKNVPHRSVHRYLRKFGVGRRLGISTVGMLVLVPQDAREGDMICNFSDANLLFLLRKQGKHHVLVGEAFLPKNTDEHPPLPAFSFGKLDACKPVWSQYRYFSII